MRQIKPETPADLHAAQDRFVASWGQMGSTWGISRTMAEIHALLYIVGEPMCTDDVMARLSISRGSASMSLRGLVDWGLASRIHKRGDRKEYFEAEQDVWAIARAIIRERLKREVTPVLVGLYEQRDATESAGASSAALEAHVHRLENMVELVRTIDELGRRFVEASGDELRATAALLAAGDGEDRP